MLVVLCMLQSSVPSRNVPSAYIQVVISHSSRQVEHDLVLLRGVLLISKLGTALGVYQGAIKAAGQQGSKWGDGC